MTISVWRKYAEIFRGTFGRALIGAVLAIATGLLLVPIPLLVGYAFDRLIPGRETNHLLLLGLAMLGLQLLHGASTLATRYIILGVTKQASARLRQRAVDRLLAAPRAQYTSRGLSTMHDTVVHEIDRIDQMSNALLGDVAPAIILSLGICGVLVAMNWQLFLGMLAVVPLNILAARWLGARVRARASELHHAYKRFSEGIIFLVRTIDLTRIQTAERVEVERQGERIDGLRGTSSALSWTALLYTVSQQALIATAGVLVLIVGGQAAATGSMTIGNLLSFFAGILLLRGPLHVIMSSAPKIMDGAQSLHSVIAFLEETDREPYQGSERIDFSGAVSLRDVSFAYGQQRVLSSISLDLAPGECVGLVGPNGSGKSTIVNLILGFYRPQRGTLVADGTVYDRLDMSLLRRSIGVVTQDALLVPGTIRDNLTYGYPDVSPDDLLEASRLAGVDKFVSRLDLGYDTPVGDDGGMLSGGQRQRLALARALVGKPKLLILDEPTNHLDEADSAAFLRRFLGGVNRPAILLISHRTDAVAVASRIYRLERGSIAEIVERDADVARR